MTDRRNSRISKKRKRLRDRTLTTEATTEVSPDGAGSSTALVPLPMNVWERATLMQATEHKNDTSTLTTTTTATDEPAKPKDRERHARVAKAVAAFLERTLNKGVKGLAAEYIANPKEVVPTEVTAFKENTSHAKNRFNDLACLDSTRVVLKKHTTSYIHANYITSVRSQSRFIVTQAPMETTIIDFWRMVVQEHVEQIVMLCDFFEDNRSKCAKYFPATKGDRVQFENYEISNSQVSEMLVEKAEPEEGKVTTSELKVTTRSGVQRLQHHRWTNWKDRKVPAGSQTVLALLHGIRSTHKPIVVHCSTGIGRACTFVAIEVVLESLFQGHECQMDTFLTNLRKQRAYAVSTDLQYVFLHKAVLDYMKGKGKIKSKDHDIALKKFSEDYQKFANESQHLK